MRWTAGLLSLAACAAPSAPTQPVGAEPATDPDDPPIEPAPVASSAPCPPEGWTLDGRGIASLLDQRGEAVPTGAALRAIWLSFDVTEDDRPMHAENAIVLLTVGATSSSPAHWHLAHIARVNPPSDWSVMHVYDVGMRAFVTYDAPPTFEQASDFLVGALWTSELVRLSRELASGHCRAAWIELFGQAPEIGRPLSSPAP